MRLITVFSFFTFCFFLIMLSCGASNNSEASAEIEKKPSREQLLLELENNMVAIPAALFTMGCNEETEYCFRMSRPAHQVLINGFKISKFKVTQALWDDIMGGISNNCNQCPANNIKLEDINDFVDNLNKISETKYRLPTEAEWEYAASAGGKYKEVKDVIPMLNEEGGVHPVGKTKPNDFGLYDIFGTGYEVCVDWFRPFYGKSEINPKGGLYGTFKVIKGGTPTSATQDMLYFQRNGYRPGFNSGLRLVTDYKNGKERALNEEELFFFDKENNCFGKECENLEEFISISKGTSIEYNYSELMTVGKRELANRKYDDARNIFEKAKKIKNTEEVNAEIQRCNALINGSLMESLYKNVESDMQLVRGGSFAFGEKKPFSNEVGMVKKVEDFYLGKFEVTQYLWYNILKLNTSNNNICYHCPITNISSSQIDEFIKALNEKTGKKFRLPTEIEWEYAAIANTTINFDDVKFLDDHSWNYYNAGLQVNPVGLKSANKFGLYDMIGNVFEACVKESETSEIEANKEGILLVKGGSYSNGKNRLKPSFSNPYYQSNSVGFRLALDK